MIGKHVGALAGILAIAASAVSAQPFQGVYLGAGAGYGFQEDIALPKSRSTVRSNGGVTGSGSVGYGFGNGFRAELEGNFRNSGITHLTNTFGSFSTSGSLRTYGVMGNVLFDMDVASPWVYPYLGAGAGYAWTSSSNLFGNNSQGTRGRPALQAMGGLSFPMPGVPGLSVTTEYRYFAAIGDAAFSVPGGTVTFGNQYNHSLLAGVRYAFGVTPPVAAAAPVPAPAATVAAARSYSVFFDWDKATLTDRARSIVKEAADNSTRVQTTRIEVNGYTDSSGTAGYNQGLSMKRADTVANELVKNGVPKAAIAIQGFGQTKQLVPTGADVREPQNRRVEIIIK